MPAPLHPAFDTKPVKQHCRAALTWLRVRSPKTKALDPESLTEAAGHLRAIAEATGLTPPQVCDVLHIHGWRRRGVMPPSGYGFRFRMRRREAIQARTVTQKHPFDGLVTETMIAARPHKRIKRFRLTDAANDDPLAP